MGDYTVYERSFVCSTISHERTNKHEHRTVRITIRTFGKRPNTRTNFHCWNYWNFFNSKTELKSSLYRNVERSKFKRKVRTVKILWFVRGFSERSNCCFGLEQFDVPVRLFMENCRTNERTNKIRLSKCSCSLTPINVLCAMYTVGTKQMDTNFIGISVSNFAGVYTWVAPFFLIIAGGIVFTITILCCYGTFKEDAQMIQVVRSTHL